MSPTNLLALRKLHSLSAPLTARWPTAMRGLPLPERSLREPAMTPPRPPSLNSLCESLDRRPRKPERGCFQSQRSPAPFGPWNSVP